MTELHQQACEACRVGAPKVSSSDATIFLKELPDWKIIQKDSVDQLIRKYSFKNFVDALAFTNKIGELAEEFNHHPEIRTEWGKVTLLWWTHKISGLHKTDFILAAKSDLLYK